MASPNVSILDGNSKCSPPTTFCEAWASIMKCPLKRGWAFNRRIPTPNELLRGRDYWPFSKSVLLDNPADAFKSCIEELYCTTRILSDGTHLGFTLNSACIELSASFFAPFESCFSEHQVQVCRLICGTVSGRLYAMEFCWLKTGGLTIRFGPHLSLSTSKRDELRIDHTVYAFLPSDASTLNGMALCAGAAREDFVNMRFDRILLSKDWYMLKVSDLYFQSSCVFCGSRGLAVCGCPLPMRRRCMGWTPETIGYKVRAGRTCWEEFATAKATCANQCTMVFNVTKTPHSRLAKTIGSGVFPLNLTVRTNVETSECLQKHLRLTGKSVDPRRMLLIPFGEQDSGERKLMSSASSLEEVASTIIASSYDSEELMPSSNEQISLIPSTGNRGRLRIGTTHASNAPNAVDSRKDKSFGDVDTVINASNMVQNSSPDVLEELLDNERSKSGSARSRTKFKKRAPLQTQSKLYPCPECGKCIRNKRYNLRRHVKAVHEKEKKFECRLAKCGQRFQTKANLKRHIFTVHKLEEMVHPQNQQVEQKQPEQRLQQTLMTDTLI